MLLSLVLVSVWLCVSDVHFSTLESDTYDLSSAASASSPIVTSATVSDSDILAKCKPVD